MTWNTNCLLYGMRGFTALSPCWQGEGAPGQVPLTALTRRHVYTRGHSMGPDGFSTVWKGEKLWFLDPRNLLVERRIVRGVVRVGNGPTGQDYSILMLDKDLPQSITPMRVSNWSIAEREYPAIPNTPHPIFKKEQAGYISAEVPGWTVPTWKGGDSGSPDMLPMPGELVFYGGRSTSGPSPEMEADIEQLCRLEKVDPAKYRLQWAQLVR